MKPADVRKMRDEELNVEEDRLRRELFDLRTQAVTEKLENPRKFQVVKRDIARILTEKRARQSKTA